MKGYSMRLPFKRGRLLWLPEDIGEAISPGNLFWNGWLHARHLDKYGQLLNQYDLGSGLITDVGVAELADDWFDGSGEVTDFKYHDSGTGVTAANVGDTTLGTQAGPTTRATGTQSNPTAPVVRSVGTIDYTGTLAITEWGLFNQAAQGGILWDRRVFSAINVGDGDSIEFTYNCTLTSGG